ncbi:hypothetical protein ABUL39_14275 [Rhodothermus marinus]|uniref:hypothetical protein n=1 Tax=Rhodothermus marinus TaxID=29549 RepID=UPI0037CC613C
MRTRTGLTLLVLLLSAAAGVSAQPVPPRGTLLEWGAGLRRLILDRTHGYGGRYYEGGLFRTFTRQMDYEYELDLLTYRFTLLLGYRRPALELTVGVSSDQDGDLYSGWGIPSQWRSKPARFDGGFFRLQLTWP